MKNLKLMLILAIVSMFVLSCTPNALNDEKTIDKDEVQPPGDRP